MLDMESIKTILKCKLKEKRYIHSLGVQQTAIQLAKIHNGSVEKASIAGLIHDCAKDLDEDESLQYVHQLDILLDDVELHQKQLQHGVIGAQFAKKKFDIQDEEILEAIRYHTTGKENMSLLEKIIYLADLIEPNRSFEGIENLRRQALSDLDNAVLMAFDHTIKYVIEMGALLHPCTIHARNNLLLKIKRFR